jgi:single-strand DNA-binding protein
MYLNKAIVFGNLTRDPELRSLPSGIQVASFSVATNRVYKDKDGQRKEQVEYHNIVVFGKQADLVSRYMKKGSSILVEGRMQTRSWDADGGKKYRTEIVADGIQFGPRGGSAPSGGQSDAGASAGPSHTDDKPAKAAGAMDTIEYPDEEISPDDIPF